MRSRISTVGVPLMVEIDIEGGKQYQLRYWKELTQLRAQIEYLNLYGSRSEYMDNGLVIFLAITSSGSIAAWAVWHQVPWLWGLLIALSQLVSAVKQHLPYQRREKAIQNLTPALESLFLRAEADWFKVSEGEWNNAQINSALTKVKQHKLEISGRYL